MVGLGLVQSLYRAHHAVVPAIAWHLVFNWSLKRFRFPPRQQEPIDSSPYSIYTWGVDSPPCGRRDQSIEVVDAFAWLEC